MKKAKIKLRDKQKNTCKTCQRLIYIQWIRSNSKKIGKGHELSAKNMPRPTN